MTPLARLETLQKLVGLSNVKKSNVIANTAKSKDPQRAADIANTWAKAFIEVNLDLSHAGAKSKREFLEKQSQMMKDRLNDPSMRLNQESKPTNYLNAKLLSDLQGAKLEDEPSTTQVSSWSTRRSTPRNPSAQKEAIGHAGFHLGLALGFQLAFLMDRMRDHVFNEDVLKAKTGLPNYAIVPDYHEEYPEGFEPPSADERFSPKTLIQNPVFQHAFYRESFKVLRTNLTYAEADRPLKTISVLSPGPGEGKTLVNANLAIALSQSGKKTLLVDADFRKSSVHKIFGLTELRPGGLPSALRSTEVERLVVLVRDRTVVPHAQHGTANQPGGTVGECHYEETFGRDEERKRL
jgi:capsular polysaccharide biosynthesis protein